MPPLIVLSLLLTDVWLAVPLRPGFSGEGNFFELGLGSNATELRWSDVSLGHTLVARYGV